MTKIKNYWTIAYWLLLVCWIVGAALSMYRVHGGIITSYLADLTFPAWFYISLRGLVPGKEVINRIRWFGGTPERAFVSIFLVGVLSELSSFYWPRGPFGGTFDPFDIFLFAAGMAICFYFDKRETERS